MSVISKSNAGYIAAKAVANAFDLEARTLLAKEHDLFSRALKEIWKQWPGVVVTKSSGLPTYAPDGLYPMRSTVTFATPTGRIALNGPYSVPLPHTINDTNWSGAKVNLTLSQEIADFAFERKAHEKRVEDTKAKTVGTLLAYKTWNSLREGWPEIWPYASVYEPRPITGSAVLVIDKGHLNDVLGLPPKSLEVA